MWFCWIAGQARNDDGLPNGNRLRDDRRYQKTPAITRKGFSTYFTSVDMPQESRPTCQQPF